MAEAFKLSSAISHLPLPLAQTLRRAINAKSPQEQHNGAYYFFESALKLGASAQCGVYLSVDCPDAAANKLLDALTRPSVGQWLQLLRELSRVLGTRKDMALLPLAGMHERLTNKQAMPAAQAFLKFAAQSTGGQENRQQLRVLDVFDGIVAYRNQELGHGAQRERAFYSEAAPLLVDAVLEALEIAKPFGDLQLAVSRDVLDAGSQRAHRRYDILRGDGLHIPLEGSHPDDAKIGAGRLVLAAGNTRVQLHPFVVYEVDRMDRDRVGFLNQVATRGKGDTAQIKRVEYLDYDSGERLEAHDAVNELAALLSRVRGATVTAESVDGMTRAESVTDDGTAAPESGQWIGDFELVSELGRGGMGIVYEALQGSLKRHVALKVLPPGIAGDPIAVARFKREIAALGRCDHPNVVKVLTAGQEGDRHYYAMEYVEGSDLSQIYGVLSGWRMQSDGELREGHLREAISSARSSRGEKSKPASGVAIEPALPKKESDVPVIDGGRDYYIRIAEILADAARGVEHLHQHGIIHRDLKPGNIMLTSDSKRAVIMDLGLAQMQDRSLSLTASSVKILGTLRYMPPEQLQHNLLEVTPKADVYSLGATLYELAVLAPIFDGDSEAKLIAQVLQQEPKPPRSINRSVPRDLETIISVATAKNPSERYATAAHLADDLERFARGDPIAAKPPSTFHYLKLFYRKNRGLVRTAAAALAILVAVVAVFMQQLASALTTAEEQREHAQSAEQSAKKARGVAEQEREKAMEAAKAEGEARDAVQEKAKEVEEALQKTGSALEQANRNLARVHLEKAALARERGYHRAALAHVIAAAELAYRNPEHAAEFLGAARSEIREADARAPLKVWDSPAGPFSDTEGVQQVDSQWNVAAAMDGLRKLHLYSLRSGQVFRTIQLPEDVSVLQLLPGGQRFALGFRTGVVEIRSARDGSTETSIMAHDIGVKSLNVSADGSILFSTGEVKTLRAWRTSDWSLLQEVPLEDADGWANRVSADGSALVTLDKSTDSNKKTWKVIGLTNGQVYSHVESSNVPHLFPDGKRAITYEWDAEHAELWDLDTDPATKLVDIECPAAAVAFPPGTQSPQWFLAMGWRDGVNMMDVATGKRLVTFAEQSTSLVTISPDGTMVACGSRRGIEFFNLQGEQLNAPDGYAGSIAQLEVSPDGRWVVTSSEDNRAKLWNAHTMQLERELGQVNPKTRFTWSPEARWLWIADPGQRLARLDAQNQFERQVVPAPEGSPANARCLSYAPDASRVLALCEQSLCVLDAESGANLSTWSCKWSVKDVIFLAGDIALLVPDWNAKFTTIHLTTGEVTTISGPAEIQRVLSVSSDGKHAVVSLGNDGVAVWPIERDARLRKVADHYFHQSEDFARQAVGAPFLADGRRFLHLRADGLVELHSLEATRPTNLLYSPEDSVVAARLGANDEFLFTGHTSGALRLWRLNRTPVAQRIASLGNEVLELMVSPGGESLIIAGEGAGLLEIDLKTGAKIRRLECDAFGLIGLQRSADGRHLFCGGAVQDKDADQGLQGRVYRWNVQTGALENTYRFTDFAIVFGIALTSDGRNMIVGGPGQDRLTSSVQEWSIESGELVRTLARPKAPVFWIGLDATGDKLAYADASGRIALLDYKSGAELASTNLVILDAVLPCWDVEGKNILLVNSRGELQLLNGRTLAVSVLSKGHDKAGVRVKASPDGKRAVSSARDGTLRVWDLVEGKPRTRLAGGGSMITGVEISLDGTRVFAGNRKGDVYTWNIAGDARLASLLNNCTVEELLAWGRARSGAFMADLTPVYEELTNQSVRWNTPAGNPPGEWGDAEIPDWLAPAAPPSPFHAIAQWRAAEADDARQAIARASTQWELQFEGYRYREVRMPTGTAGREAIPPRAVDGNGNPVGPAQGYIDFTAWWNDNMPDHARWQLAAVRIQQVYWKLSLYYVMEERYPDSLDALRGEIYFKGELPLDPFTGKAFAYELDGNGFRMRCLGKDGSPGGAEVPEKDIFYTEAGLVGN